MGKKYYCEYCDKAFKDDLSMRKKHLDSVQHQKLRRDHYNKFRDLASILKEEILKKPCNRHTPPTQECAFGSICRFSHYSRDQLIQMDLKLKYKEEMKRIKSQPKPITADLEGFLRQQNQQHVVEEANNELFWEYSDKLVQQMPHLPPSMHKFDATRLVAAAANYVEWG